MSRSAEDPWPGTCTCNVDNGNVNDEDEEEEEEGMGVATSTASFEVGATSLEARMLSLLLTLLPGRVVTGGVDAAECD